MDLIHKKIEYKFSLVFGQICEDSLQELNDLHMEYLMIYTNIILSKAPTINCLLQSIVYENIIDRLDKIAHDTIKNNNVLDEYVNVSINHNPVTIQYKLCSICQYEMSLSYDQSYYECLDCSIVESIQSGTKERNIPRSRIGNFNPERHFKTWVDRILARESEDELKSADDETGENVINTVKQHLIDKRKSSEHLTIDDIRNVLKEIGKTHLNKNTSLIAKKITGRAPPKLSDQKYMTIYAVFLRVMEARDKISNSTRCNRIYYPFYIWKLFSIYLTTPEERKILNYIHLHKEQTLSSNDKEWCDIIKQLPELKGCYEPTVNSHCRYI